MQNTGGSLVIFYQFQRLFLFVPLLVKSQLGLIAFLIIEGVELPVPGEESPHGGQGGHQGHVVEAEVYLGDSSGLATQPQHLPGPGHHQAAARAEADCEDGAQPGSK